MALRVTQGGCDVRGIDVRLNAPFRPSASYFEGSKYAKSRLRFRPDFVGFLRVVSDIAVEKRFRLRAVANYRATLRVACRSGRSASSLWRFASHKGSAMSV
ncbi:hypothetical protein E2N90_23585, partial [Pseudomonas syringae pv. tomato]